MTHVSKVLYPTDFSDFSISALPWAIDLSERFGAQFYCLHVVDEAFQYWAPSGENVLPAAIPYEELLESGRAQMRKFLEQNLPGKTETIHQAVVLGNPFAEIVNYARDQQIDLIVLATHGRSALATMLLGSTAEKVVRKAPCPVLTVKPAGHLFKMP